MIFDVKMEDFCRKYYLVASSHMTETLATMTYAKVIYRENVRLDLVIFALNYLELKCVDVMNMYITTPIEEDIWTNLEPDFGPDASKRALFVHAGLKSAPLRTVHANNFI